MPVIASMVLIAASAVTGDPVAACRAVNDLRSPAYVTCLEDALRRAVAARGAVPESERRGDRGERPHGDGDDRSERQRDDDRRPPAVTHELGADQLEQARRNRGEDADQPIAVEIVQVDYGAGQLATVTLANGQQWRETSTTPRGKRLVAGKSYRGRIERGAVGGYRLYVDGIKHMYTVRRLR